MVRLLKEILVSIVIPAYNRENLIRQTLDSVLVQTYPHWECIIVDDGSTDKSDEVVQAYCATDKRFIYFRREREPKGAPTCRNVGLEKANGDYVIFLDSDDLLAEHCLQERVHVISNHPGYDFWVFPTACFKLKPGDSQKRWNILNKPKEDLIRFIAVDLPWHTMGPIWDIQSIKNLQGFDEAAPCWQDWELHVRALLMGLKYYKVKYETPDSYYRERNRSVTDSISLHHSTFEHAKFRLSLFMDYYMKVMSRTSNKDSRTAFQILFFKLFKELKAHGANIQVSILMSFLNQHKLYSSLEMLLLSQFARKLSNTFFERWNKRVCLATLYLINKNVYCAKSNPTFQA